MVNARQRLSDVKKLRTNILQSFFKLICVNDWQTLVFNYINKTKTAHSDAYNAMILKGNTYSIEDMDDTLLMEIFYRCRECRIDLIDQDLVKMIKDLKVDRNHYSHSNENENDEELYLTGLLDLCRLSMFLKRFNTFETSIIDEERNILFKKYYPMVENLKDLMDNERITKIQIEKSIRSDIDEILKSQDTNEMYFKKSNAYFQMYFLSENKKYIYLLFLMYASEVGLTSSPYDGLEYYFYIHDYIAYVKKLIEITNKLNVITYDDADRICEHINFIISHKHNGNYLKSFIEKLKKITLKKDEDNYKIEKNEIGLLILKKQTPS